MPYLTGEQFDDWMAYYDRHPWGPQRDDARQEAFRQRLLVSMWGKAGSKSPDAYWPYFPKPIDPQEELAAMKATESRLEWNGSKYVWKN